MWYSLVVLLPVCKAVANVGSQQCKKNDMSDSLAAGLGTLALKSWSRPHARAICGPLWHGCIGCESV
jgi:hypothetical protein